MEPAESVYELLINTLNITNQSEKMEILAETLIHGVLNLLRIIGYRPELTRCIACKRTMTPNDWLFLSAMGGGLICRDCEPTIQEKIRMEHRAWYYLLGKVHDPASGGMAFEVLNYLLREYLHKTPVMTRYCTKLFSDAAKSKITK
jgi:recombinational DNA repair protein (RecF pathway)